MRRRLHMIYVSVFARIPVGVKFPPWIFGDLDNDFDVKWLIFLTNW